MLKCYRGQHLNVNGGDWTVIIVLHEKTGRKNLCILDGSLGLDDGWPVFSFTFAELHLDENRQYYKTGCDKLSLLSEKNRILTIHFNAHRFQLKSIKDSRPIKNPLLPCNSENLKPPQKSLHSQPGKAHLYALSIDYKFSNCTYFLKPRTLSSLPIFSKLLFTKPHNH